MALARVLAMLPDHLLFDEATSALDPQLLRRRWRSMNWRISFSSKTKTKDVGSFWLENFVRKTPIYANGFNSTDRRLRPITRARLFRQDTHCRRRSPTPMPASHWIGLTDEVAEMPSAWNFCSLGVTPSTEKA
jgi:hypothetical protein